LQGGFGHIKQQAVKIGGCERLLEPGVDLDFYPGLAQFMFPICYSGLF
jgi:hypothetical protein